MNQVHSSREVDIAGRMVLFAHTVQHGSFSAAARDLGLTPSAVSKQISRLEDHLGVRLFHRSTRSINLTSEGRAFYERCARIADDVADAQALASSFGSEVQGHLKVVATVAFAKNQLLPLLPEFLQQYPELRLDLELTDRAVDLVEENIDVAIRFTEQIEDTSVVARRLASNKRVVCASPAYLEAHGIPQTPDELMTHNCLRLSTVGRWNDWEFGTGEARRVIKVNGHFEANSADAIYHAVVAGVGIARLSTYLVHKDICDGRLVRVLPQYTQEDADILAVYPNRRNLTPRVRAFIDYLVQQLGPIPPWERPTTQ